MAQEINVLEGDLRPFTPLLQSPPEDLKLQAGSTETQQPPENTANQNLFNQIFGVPRVDVNVKPGINNTVIMYTLLIFVLALFIISYAASKIKKN